jgi:hypothetical protein
MEKLAEARETPLPPETAPKSPEGDLLIINSLDIFWGVPSLGTDYNRARVTKNKQAAATRLEIPGNCILSTTNRPPLRGSESAVSAICLKKFSPSPFLPLSPSGLGGQMV